MKIYLDDERVTPKGWVRAYWPEEAIEFLKAGNVSSLSLDHDLGEDSCAHVRPRTGYDVVLWLEEQVICHGFKPPMYMFVHSSNESAKIKMKLGLKKIHEFASANQGFIEIEE